ncbi:assimilatory sulfite reductase (NADPH) flavoprotein subunit [Halalkalibacterium ligniniphilum]|uniref:assimilatory sulfite reductase (NADPH) flavoprotein subunit n=1 Tax=Halalkalibacterium ligniniphilum TaxID=1134413 RepID=UPI000346715C|nr:assimilatory sulfite reductase (NADPH) flavoprotein subunit [Halalkalibacterium ligniniphilum]
MDFHVKNSPFNEEQVESLNRLLPTLTELQKVWLSGYLTAQLSVPMLTESETQTTELPAQSNNNTKSKEVTILYGSQTGNSQKLAEDAGKKLEGIGFQVTVTPMNDFKNNNLKKVQNLLIVVSTHGEGEPPDNALSFYEFLHSKRAPKLDNLCFSVLSLGDSSYEFFCKTGKDFDQQLEKQGGQRIFPRVDCDIDFEEPAARWLEGVMNGLGEVQGGNTETIQAATPKTVESPYSRTNPFRAEVLENINLNGRGSNKETRHIELSIEGSGFTYEPGDVVGIYPSNDPALIDMLLQELNLNPDDSVTVNKQGDTYSLKEALISYFEINLTKSTLEQAVKFSANKELSKLLLPENKKRLKAYIDGRDLLDLVRDFGISDVKAQEFVSILRKQRARLYSIASSLLANPDEVHLTIGAVRYEAHGRERKGVCSTYCAERIQPGDTLPIYIQSNKQFKLPEDPNASIIMVGPGTGIAPFRSFMQEREETGAQGKSWMFFGDQHFTSDFLYQTEWQKWLKDGVLTKMDVAFSRDTDKKIYVQHRMLEQRKELFAWIQEGASVYVCGDKTNMAKDVHHALINIIETEGNMTHEEAEAYLANMIQQKRYQRDIY